MDKKFGLLMAIVLSLVITPAIPVFASTSGSVKEEVTNEEMQVYVYNVKEGPWMDPNDATRKQVDVEIIIKNAEPDARVFNMFFVRMIDNLGKEYRANPLQSTILPVRIASNDILNGRLTFVIPTNAVPSFLVWKEPDSSEITIDLTKTKDPADLILQSDWILMSNKDKKLSDGRSELTIHDELMNNSPRMYAVEISIKNTSNEIIRYSPSYAFVKDEKGYLYPIDLHIFGAVENPLRNGDLKPGESVRGSLLFSLADDANKVMFIYDEEIGLGSYFAVPEFPIAIVILLSSISVVVLATLRIKRELN